MNPSKGEIALLGDISDDFYGLWEVDWYFNGHHPEWSREARTAFFSSLVQRGLIEVFSGPLMSVVPPLAQELAMEALMDPVAWASPTADQAVGYYATTSAAGFAALLAPGS